jgi:ubiquinone/menaquinone biosynthesis C-methylase UbiE
MPMNLIHRRICSSAKWGQQVRDRLMPWALKDVPLGDSVLEIGPGFGATTRVLTSLTPSLTIVEVDPASARRLSAQFPSVRVIEGDGASLPLEDNSFSAVTCFTMLHHVPSVSLQDRLFAEAWRVLRPGGVFAGVDSRVSLRFRILHIRDTMVVVDPVSLPDRLRAAGFVDVAVETVPGAFRFRATRPARP